MFITDRTESFLVRFLVRVTAAFSFSVPAVIRLCSFGIVREGEIVHFGDRFCSVVFTPLERFVMFLNLCKFFTDSGIGFRCFNLSINFAFGAAASGGLCDIRGVNFALLLRGCTFFGESFGEFLNSPSNFTARFTHFFVLPLINQGFNIAVCRFYISNQSGLDVTLPADAFRMQVRTLLRRISQSLFVLRETTFFSAPLGSFQCHLVDAFLCSTHMRRLGTEVSH